MTLASAVMTALQKLIVQDVQRKDDSRIRSFLVRNTKGGWEPWFQVEAAHALIHAGLATDFDREQRVKTFGMKDPKTNAILFLASDEICDLVSMNPSKGTNIFIEMKTQRSGAYQKTLSDFEKDLKKFQAYGPLWNATYPCFAIALLTVADNQKDLDDLRARSQGRLEYYVFPKVGEDQNPMSRVTDAISKYKPRGENILLAVWRNSI